MCFISFGVGLQEKKSVFGRIVSGPCSHLTDFLFVLPHRFPPSLSVFPLSGRTRPDSRIRDEITFYDPN